jgi:hypothetical protein
MSPGIAQSRSVRKLVSSAVVSARSRPQESRAVPDARPGLGFRPIQVRQQPAAATRRRAAALSCTGLGAAGSRVAQKPNRPRTAASG